MTEVIAAMLFGLAYWPGSDCSGGILGVLGFVCIVFSAYLAHEAFGGWFAPLVTFLVGSLGAILMVFLSSSGWLKAAWQKPVPEQRG